MGKKRKAKDVDEQEVRFDPQSRHEFITGFKKRKEARRKTAMRELINKARQEKIDVKREHREEIKKRWKDVLWAERTVDRVLLKRAALMQEKQQQLALEDGSGKTEKLLALKANGEGESDDESDGLDPHDDGGDGWIPQALMDEENARLPQVTVSFDKEDDDPFGDCEVTTTAVALPGRSGTAADVDRNKPLSAALSLKTLEERALALSRLGPDGNPMTVAQLEEHKRRRAINIKKDESRRVAAMDRQIKKDKVEKRRMRKKSKKNKPKKGAKAGAKQRRRRVKKK